MIPQCGINTQRCIQLVEHIHVFIHFRSHIIHQVTGKKDQVRFLQHEFLYAFYHSLLIGETASVNI